MGGTVIGTPPRAVGPPAGTASRARVRVSARARVRVRASARVSVRVRTIFERRSGLALGLY